MSAGFTMVYSSIYDGTLMGQWPAAAVFATLLPLADKNGDIDLKAELIAYKTGWPIQELLKGIEQLMQPDPHSRTKVFAGSSSAMRSNHSWSRWMLLWANIAIAWRTSAVTRFGVPRRLPPVFCLRSSFVFYTLYHNAIGCSSSQDC